MLTGIASSIKAHQNIKAHLYQALKNKRLAHALLFFGTSGVGKREMAWALAQNLLCEQKTPCGKCTICLNLLKKQSEHVFCVTHETLQIRLQDVKAIPNFLALQTFAKAKVVLIDEADKLNIQASNFLLKIIEEPPPKSFFFLISSNSSKLSLTIRSRVQTLKFQPLSDDVIKELARAGTDSWIIRGSRGSLELLRELKYKTEIREGAFKLWQEVFQNPEVALAIDFPKRLKSRKEAIEISRFWLQILRDARFLKSGNHEEIIHGDKQEELEELSKVSKGVLDTLMKKILQMEMDLQANVDYSLCFEHFLIYMKKCLKDKSHW